MPDTREWTAGHPAIWRELYQQNRQDQPHTITLRHPTYPFTAELTNPTDEQLGEQLTTIAAKYLRRVAGSGGFGFPEELLGASDDDEKFLQTKALIPLAWLPLVDNGQQPDASSFWINHNVDAPQPARVDRTAILLAVPSIEVNNHAMALGSHMAIRVVAHVTPEQPTVRITGATCSAELLRIAALSRKIVIETFVPFARRYLEDAEERQKLLNRVVALTGLDINALWIDGFTIRTRPERDPVFEVFLTYEQKPPEPAYVVTARVPSSGDIDKMFAQMTVRKRPLVSHCADAADVREYVFNKNPPTRVRPNRSSANFAHDLKRIKMPGLSSGPSTSRPGVASTTLRDRQDAPNIEVMQSLLVNAEAKEGEVETVKLPLRHVRTNEFAAMSAYQHAQELIATLQRYGFVPKSYFKHATLPLQLRYRAGIYPGPGKDGKTVNAMVDYDSPRRSHRSTANVSGKTPRPLQIRFALGDLQRSASRREPLGVACDPRWAWHEYAHVLIAASTGALELNFVHSTGDALAAIQGDPSVDVHDPKRTATFPWVFLNRWHDRSVHTGWSWCGSYHRQSYFPPDSPFRRKGYRSEQILSTSLFRLYRSLGGDTDYAVGIYGNANDDNNNGNNNDNDGSNEGETEQAVRETVRRRAADYTAYLIMRAIAWIGPVTHLTAETPDQFVSALIDADVGTLHGPSPPEDVPGLPLRVGGCAHKVVRWAFETQGLYATNDPDMIVNAPGRPPAVDVFIDDGRKGHDDAHQPGAYTPVSFADASWHATEDAVRIDGNGNVTVKVGNRGTATAHNVTVDVWYADRPKAPAPPKWDGHAGGTPAWRRLGTTGTKNVAAGATETFDALAGLPTDRPLLVLAAATCAEDPANIDDTTALPCAKGAPLVDLVTGDNNLGLRRYGEAAPSA